MAGQENKPQTQEELSALLKVRREKLENLQNEGKDPFVITKYNVSVQLKSFSDSCIECRSQRLIRTQHGKQVAYH